MRSFESFLEEALRGSGVQNDSQDVWVEVDGEQYTVKVSDVLGREETEAFEASYILEEDASHEAWKELYSQYAVSYTHLTLPTNSRV